ncbi:hypothetical protein [Dokdonia sp. Hel_I_63]|nr:hypothetical protein [Dokdonia sp. Hel_I_63]
MHLNKPLRKPSASPVTIGTAFSPVLLFLIDCLNIQVFKKDVAFAKG